MEQLNETADDTTTQESHPTYIAYQPPSQVPMEDEQRRVDAPTAAHTLPTKAVAFECVTIRYLLLRNS